MRALITGMSGFIGGHLFHSAPEHWEVWGTYLDSVIHEDATRALRIDLRDPIAINAILRGIKPDLIIHCAAYSHVAFCETAPTAAWEMNTWVTGQLAEICSEQEIRLIFLSSDMVFDGIKGNYCEQDIPQPVNFYGWTKLGAERRLLEIHGKTVILRVNLTYGRPRVGGTSFSEEVMQVVSNGRLYYLFADQLRSFISVKNLSQCIWELAGSDWSGLLHLGGSEAADRVTFAMKLAKQVGLDPNLLIPSSAEKVIPHVNYPLNNTFDLTLASSLLKTPLLGLDAGLASEYPT